MVATDHPHYCPRCHIQYICRDANCPHSFRSWCEGCIIEDADIDKMSVYRDEPEDDDAA